jgi:cytochrome c-type biogenesis protein
MLDISYPVAFWAGFLSFFAPCVVPLFPIYLAYISGDSVDKISNIGSSKFKKNVIISSLLYILGFSLMFILLGTSIAGAGIILRRHAGIVRTIGGIIIILFGIQISGSVKLPLLNKGGMTGVPQWTKNLGILRPLIIGIIFASTWVPCVGPILGSILALTLMSHTVLKGALLLFTYSLGISIPFLLAAVMISSSQKYLKSIADKLILVSKISGFLMILFGLLLVSNKIYFVNAFFSDLF